MTIDNLSGEILHQTETMEKQKVMTKRVFILISLLTLAFFSLFSG